MLTVWFHYISEIYERFMNSLLQENRKVGWRGQNSERSDTWVLLLDLSFDAKLQTNHFDFLLMVFFCLPIPLESAAPDTIKNRDLGGAAHTAGSISAVFQLCHVFQSLPGQQQVGLLTGLIKNVHFSDLESSTITNTVPSIRDSCNC